jgi:hypothetical protein
LHGKRALREYDPDVPRTKKAAAVGVVLLVGAGAAVSVIGHDGVCPAGEPISADSPSDRQPTLAAARAAQRDLPEGERAVFNGYTGEFEGVDAVTAAGTYGDVSVSELLVYECDSNDEPTLVPLSEVDPEAAEEEHREMARLLTERSLGGLIGLGRDPANTPAD